MYLEKKKSKISKHIYIYINILFSLTRLSPNGIEKYFQNENIFENQIENQKFQEIHLYNSHSRRILERSKTESLKLSPRFFKYTRG